MTETDAAQMIEFCLKGEEEPFWAIRDSNVPLPDDLVSIENADGTAQTYSVESRMWFTAKQGAHNFFRVRLQLQEVKSSSYSWSGAL